jgi:hypothetical protein
MDINLKLEKLKGLVEDSSRINDQLRIILNNLNNLEDIITNGENISDRVAKACKLFSEFTEILEK